MTGALKALATLTHCRGSQRHDANCDNPNPWDLLRYGMTSPL